MFLRLGLAFSGLAAAATVAGGLSGNSYSQRMQPALAVATQNAKWIATLIGQSSIASMPGGEGEPEHVTQLDEREAVRLLGDMTPAGARLRLFSNDGLMFADTGMTEAPARANRTILPDELVQSVVRLRAWAGRGAPVLQDPPTAADFEVVASA